MVESTPTHEHDPTSPSAESFEKDVEIQSLHSSSESLHELDDEKIEKKGRDEEEVEEGEGGGKEEEGRGALGLVARLTRSSTKSSWKDPGPPPDGGLSGWTQGVWIFSLMCAWIGQEAVLEFKTLLAIRRLEFENGGKDKTS